MYSFTGNALEGFQAQRFYPPKSSIGNMFDLAGFWRSFINARSLHDAMTSVLDRFFFVVFVGSLYPIWRLEKQYFFYALFAGGVPALASHFFSFTRYVMMCFPLFVVLGQFLQAQDRRWILWYYVIMLASLQALCLLRYINQNWAG
jgi:hypothetical protein